MTATKDKGVFRGVFTIEKYDASVEPFLTRFTEQQNELAARIEYFRLLASQALDPHMYQKYITRLADCEQEHKERETWFAKTYADDVTIFENGLLNTGITLMWQLISGASTVHFDNTNSRLVVGTSNTAFSASQTGVQTALATLVMDTGYPTVTGQAINFRATAGTGTANGAWQEYCITNNTTAMNRSVSNQGTKTSSDIWVPSYSISLA